MIWNLDEAIVYYRTQGAPREQNALIALLKEVQQENGNSIPQYLVQRIADAYEIKVGMLLALIKRIPSLRIGDQNCLELCAGPNCGKHQKLASFAERLKKEHDSFTLKYIPCQRMCGKGPNIRWNGVVHNGANEALIQELVKGKG